MNSPSPAARSKRFDGKRHRIVQCATVILNERGVRGMTLAEVASAAGMVPTGIAYYFGKKEALAAACFTEGLVRLEQLVAEAAEGATARARITRLFQGYFDLRRRIARGEAPDIPIFSDIRTLGEPWGEEVRAHWRRFFGQVRDLLRTPELSWLRARAAAARTNLIVEHVLRLGMWLPLHDVEEYPRLCERMLDILLDGVALPGAAWTAHPIPLEREEAGHGLPETLLVAATRLINEHGYKGASVDKISASLQRTKGAFYHHIDGKDDLVVAGFERTFDILQGAQNRGLAIEGDAWVRLCSIVAALTAFQMSDVGPLMRISALQSLPGELQAAVLARSNRITRRFAGLMADGGADGSLRSVDPMVAAQLLNAAINAVADRRLVRTEPDFDHAPLQYAVPMMFGVLCPSVREAGALD